MSWIWPLIAGASLTACIIETLLLMGAFGLVKDHDRKMGVVLSNYKADLEMLLLAKHGLDEFIAHMEGAYQESQEAAKAVDPDQTYYIK